MRLFLSLLLKSKTVHWERSLTRDGRQTNLCVVWDILTRKYRFEIMWHSYQQEGIVWWCQHLQHSPRLIASKSWYKSAWTCGLAERRVCGSNLVNGVLYLLVILPFLSLLFLLVLLLLIQPGLQTDQLKLHFYFIYVLTGFCVAVHVASGQSTPCIFLAVWNLRR